MGDLIDRQDAIDAIRKHEINLPIYAPRETDVFWDDAIDCCVSVLEQLPSAQPERTGRWIDKGQYADFFPQHEFMCSECGRHLLEIEVDYYFCPFCGARMEGVEHE